MWIMPFIWWIVSRTFQHYTATIVYSWWPYKIVNATYWNYYYYHLINLIDIYTYYFFLFSVKYVIHNNTGKLLGIFQHQFKIHVLYIADITIMFGFISLIFHITPYLVFMFEFFTTRKHNNIVDSLFCIPASRGEPQVNSRFKMIVDIMISLLLEFDQSSSD